MLSTFLSIWIDFMNSNICIAKHNIVLLKVSIVNLCKRTKQITKQITSIHLPLKQIWFCFAQKQYIITWFQSILPIGWSLEFFIDSITRNPFKNVTFNSVKNFSFRSHGISEKKSNLKCKGLVFVNLSFILVKFAENFVFAIIFV